MGSDNDVIAAALKRVSGAGGGGQQMVPLVRAAHPGDSVAPNKSQGATVRLGGSLIQGPQNDQTKAVLNYPPCPWPLAQNKKK